MFEYKWFNNENRLENAFGVIGTAILLIATLLILRDFVIYGKIISGIMFLFSSTGLFGLLILSGVLKNADRLERIESVNNTNYDLILSKLNSRKKR